MGPHHGKENNHKDQHSHTFLFKRIRSEKIFNETNVDSPVVVWCDALIGTDKNKNDDVNTLIQLSRIINRQRKLIHTCTGLDACRDFIKDVNNVFLIVSGSMGQQLVPLVHDLEQIHSIYIFCMNKPKYESWAKQYRKIHGVFTRIEDLCESLEKYFICHSSSDCERLRFDLVSRNLRLERTDERELSFQYAILSKLILANINSINQNDMINYCRMEYKSKTKIKLIDQFENHYIQHDPIWWFTRDHFFKDIINRALQLNDLYALCMMSPFVNDLNDNLKQLYRKQIRSSSSISGPVHLYFSQSLTNDEFIKIKINQNGLMCINEFLLTTQQQNISLMFLEYQDFKHSNTNNIKVLFRIKISRNKDPNAWYANIGAECPFVHEEDYLISMSSIYHIDKVESHPDFPSIWLIDLTLLDHDNQELMNFMDSILIDEFPEHDYFAEIASKITDKLYQFRSTRKLCELLLKPGVKYIRPILLNYNMGIIYDVFNQYDKALNRYKTAIHFTRNYEQYSTQQDNLLLIPFYSNMGLTYHNMKINSNAFDHAFRALNIILNTKENSIFYNELLASVYFNLGSIVHQQGQFSEAKNYYEHALKCRYQYLPNDHRDIISLQNIINSSDPQAQERII